MHLILEIFYVVGVFKCFDVWRDGKTSPFYINILLVNENFYSMAENFGKFWDVYKHQCTGVVLLHHTRLMETFPMLPEIYSVSNTC